MARTYGRILTAMWQNPKFRQLSEHSRTVWIYLCSSPHSNAAGCFVLPAAYASHDCQLAPQRFEASMTEIAIAEMITRDGEVVFVRDWLEHNKPTGDKHARAMLSAILQCPSKPIKRQALQAFIECDSKLIDPIRDDARSELATIPDPCPDGSRTVIAKTETQTQTQTETQTESVPQQSGGSNGSRTDDAPKIKPTRLPDDFAPPQEWLDAGMEKAGLNPMEIEDAWNEFIGYWTEQSGNRAKKKDWRRTWINYVNGDICQKRVAARRRNAGHRTQAAGVVGVIQRLQAETENDCASGREPDLDRKRLTG